MQDVYERAGGVTTLVSQGLGSANGALPGHLQGRLARRDPRLLRHERAPGQHRDGHLPRHLRAPCRDAPRSSRSGRRAGTATSSRSSAGCRTTARGCSSRPTRPLVAGDTDSSQDVYSSSITTGGYPRPKGAGPLRVSLVPAYERVHGAEPRARAAAGAPLVQPAGPVVGTAHGRLAGRERARGELGRLCQAEGGRRVTRSTPADEANVRIHRLDHRCAPEVGPERLHGRAGAGRGAAHHRQAERHGARGRRHDRRPAVPGHGAVRGDRQYGDRLDVLGEHDRRCRAAGRRAPRSSGRSGSSRPCG